MSCRGEPVSLVELVRCGTRVEAAMIQARLEAADVPSYLFDSEMSWAVQCRIMVDEDDLAQACRILDDPPL